MRDIPTASFLMWSFMVLHTLIMNWWGTTKIRMSAPLTDSAKSGTANWWRERKYGETSMTWRLQTGTVQCLTSHQRVFSCSPHWGAACDRADISHFRALCWWFPWVYGRSPSPRTPTCSPWSQMCHTWRRWHPQSWQWQSPCWHGGAQWSLWCNSWLNLLFPDTNKNHSFLLLHVNRRWISMSFIDSWASQVWLNAAVILDEKMI